MHNFSNFGRFNIASNSVQSFHRNRRKAELAYKLVVSGKEKRKMGKCRNSIFTRWNLVFYLYLAMLLPLQSSRSIMLNLKFGRKREAKLVSNGNETYGGVCARTSLCVSVRVLRLSGRKALIIYLLIGSNFSSHFMPQAVQSPSLLLTKLISVKYV